MKTIILFILISLSSNLSMAGDNKTWYNGIERFTNDIKRFITAVPGIANDTGKFILKTKGLLHKKKQIVSDTERAAFCKKALNTKISPNIIATKAHLPNAKFHLAKNKKEMEKLCSESTASISTFTPPLANTSDRNEITIAKENTAKEYIRGSENPFTTEAKQ